MTPGPERTGKLSGIKDLEGRIPGIEIVVIGGATHGGEAGAHYRPEFVQAIRQLLKAN